MWMYPTTTPAIESNHRSCVASEGYIGKAGAGASRDEHPTTIPTACARSGLIAGDGDVIQGGAPAIDEQSAASFPCSV